MVNSRTIDLQKKLIVVAAIIEGGFLNKDFTYGQLVNYILKRFANEIKKWKKINGATDADANIRFIISELVREGVLVVVGKNGNQKIVRVCDDFSDRVFDLICEFFRAIGVDEIVYDEDESFGGYSCEKADDVFISVDVLNIILKYLQETMGRRIEIEDIF